MELQHFIRKVLSEDLNLQLQQLKDKNVGEGKPVSEKDFKKIEEVAQNKWYLVAWLTRRVASGAIKNEDIYKWKEYFEIYEKNKKRFEYKDINLYKTSDDIQKFIQTVVDVREGDIKFDDITNSEFFVSPNDIRKMEAGGGIKYLGLWKPKKLNQYNQQGYQVFEVSEPTKENWKLYRDMLGRCKGRDRGASIEICTIGQFSFFKNYLARDKGSRYIVLFNLNDPLSPYQLHPESQQFMNKNDIEKYNFIPQEFYKFLGSKSDRYSYHKLGKEIGFEVPGPDGYEDVKGKQGVWISFHDGEKDTETTYKNDKPDGPYKGYFKGKLYLTGTRLGDKFIGPFSKKDFLPSYNEEGTFDNKGERIGVWKLGTTDLDADYMLVDYDNPKSDVSGYTKDDKLKVISTAEYERVFTGDIVVFFKNETPKAIGKRTPKGLKTGNWQFFNYDGSIRAEGGFLRGGPVGEWNFIFTKNGKKYIFNFEYPNREQKGTLYDENGKYLEQKRYSSNFIPEFEKMVSLTI